MRKCWLTLPCFKECNIRLVLSLRLYWDILTETDWSFLLSVISFALLWAGLDSFGVYATLLHGAVFLQKLVRPQRLKNNYLCIKGPERPSPTHRSSSLFPVLAYIHPVHNTPPPPNNFKNFRRISRFVYAPYMFRASYPSWYNSFILMTTTLHTIWLLRDFIQLLQVA